MEIKCVKKEKIEYPKIDEISNKKLKTCIPNKWIKLGVTSLIFEFIMKNKVFATTDTTLDILGGDVAVIEEIPVTAYINTGIQLGTVIVFIISLLGLLLTKIKISKDKEEQKTKRVKNVFKILLIISPLVFIIWTIIYTIIKFLDAI